MIFRSLGGISGVLTSNTCFQLYNVSISLLDFLTKATVTEKKKAPVFPFLNQSLFFYFLSVQIEFKSTLKLWKLPVKWFLTKFHTEDASTGSGNVDPCVGVVFGVDDVDDGDVKK